MRFTTPFLIGSSLGLFGSARIPAHAQAQLQIQVQEMQADDPLEATRTEPEIVSDEEFNLTLDSTAAQSADQLIPRLGSPSYKEREEATAGLIEIKCRPLSSYAAYHATNNLEVLLRIEHRSHILNHVWTVAASWASTCRPTLPAGENPASARVGWSSWPGDSKHGPPIARDAYGRHHFGSTAPPFAAKACKWLKFQHYSCTRARRQMNLTVLRGTNKSPCSPSAAVRRIAKRERSERSLKS
jgi:hypothetical protein